MNNIAKRRPLHVPVLSVAELKTSLDPAAAGKVGEFLAYSLFMCVCACVTLL